MSIKINRKKFSKYKRAVNIDGNHLKLNKMGVEKRHQNGFSLVEVTIAMVVCLVVMLGLVTVFTFAVSYNAGNNSRSQALAIMQQQVELARSAKFTRNKTDNDPSRFDLTGGTKAAKIVNGADGGRFRVAISVDDDATTPAIDVNSTTTLKEIIISVTLDSPSPGWQTAIPAKVILRRTKAN